MSPQAIRSHSKASRSNEETLLNLIYDRLASHYGPTGWWPGDSAFEIAVGAILVQNTAWTNVEKAIANLKAANMLHCGRIAEADASEIESLIRPSGYFRLKTRRLQAFCSHVTIRYGGSMAPMANRPMGALREELLGIYGIGPETADCILLYACGKPVFVIDAYTRRVLSRHGLCEPTVPYEDLRATFENAVPKDVATYREYHALLVLIAKDFCKKKPNCEGCPLEPLLNEGQPLLT